MNYEEKYKEALERAKKFEEKYGGDYAGYIFPELAESEDERIRKQLIDAIKIGRSNSGISFTEEAASRYIAWLEKQKESLRDFIDDFPYSDQKEQKPIEWNANDKGFIKDCARILDENGYAASAERLLSMFPVKPTEWSEEDENMRESAIALIRKWTNYSGENVGDSIKVISWLQWLPLLAHQH